MIITLQLRYPENQNEPLILYGTENVMPIYTLHPVNTVYLSTDHPNTSKKIYYAITINSISKGWDFDAVGNSK